MSWQSCMKCNYSYELTEEENKSWKENDPWEFTVHDLPEKERKEVQEFRNGIRHALWRKLFWESCPECGSLPIVHVMPR